MVEKPNFSALDALVHSVTGRISQTSQPPPKTKPLNGLQRNYNRSISTLASHYVEENVFGKPETGPFPELKSY
jgi:hypothetical protein